VRAALTPYLRRTQILLRLQHIRALFQGRGDQRVHIVGGQGRFPTFRHQDRSAGINPHLEREIDTGDGLISPLAGRQRSDRLIQRRDKRSPDRMAVPRPEFRRALRQIALRLMPIAQVFLVDRPPNSHGLRIVIVGLLDLKHQVRLNSGQNSGRQRASRSGRLAEPGHVYG